MPKNKIAAIHSRVDDMLQRLSDLWMSDVAPQLKAPYTPVPVFGNKASRDLNPSFSSTVSDSDVVLIMGLGHGSDDEFLGWANKPLYSSTLLPPEEVRGKIVHLLSCSTGGGLNNYFRSAGCRAFVGYRKLVKIGSSTLEWNQKFLSCDARIEIVLTKGGTVAAAVQSAKTWFSMFGLGSTGADLMCDPADGQLGLQSDGSLPAPAALAQYSTPTRNLPAPNTIATRPIESNPSF